MTVFLRATAGIADQDSRILSADATLLSTRQADTNQLKRREKVYSRVINARRECCLKDMRRMRMYLVPPFESGICILP